MQTELLPSESYLGATHAHAHTQVCSRSAPPVPSCEQEASDTQTHSECLWKHAHTRTQPHSPSLRHPHTPPDPQLPQREDTDPETTGTHRHRCQIPQVPWGCLTARGHIRHARGHVSVSTRQAPSLWHVLVAAHSAGTWALLRGTDWVTHGHGL